MILFISFINMLGTKVSSKLFYANNFFSLKCSVVNLINAGLFTFKAETLTESNFKILMQWNIPPWNKTDMLIKQKPKNEKKYLILQINIIISQVHTFIFASRCVFSSLLLSPCKWAIFLSSCCSWKSYTTKWKECSQNNKKIHNICSSSL